MNCSRCQQPVDPDADDPNTRAYFVTVAETRLKFGREFFERIACAKCAAGVRLFLGGGGFVALPAQPPKPSTPA